MASMPLAAALVNSSRSTMPSASHRGLVGRHLLGDETAGGLAEVDVLGLEQAAAHDWER